MVSFTIASLIYHLYFKSPYREHKVHGKGHIYFRVTLLRKEMKIILLALKEWSPRI